MKQACNLSFDDDDDPLQYLREPKDLLTFRDPSVYYATHDETDLVKDILHGLFEGFYIEEEIVNGILT